VRSRGRGIPQVLLRELHRGHPGSAGRDRVRAPRAERLERPTRRGEGRGVTDDRWPVLVARLLPAPVMDWLNERCEVTLHEGPEAIPRDRLLRDIAGKVGAITLLTDKVDDEFLDAAGEQLVIVANYAVGFDNIDVPACSARNVFASNTPDVLTETTADLAWSLIMSAARRIAEGDRFLRTRTPWIWGPEM